jgi:hypothetical protein
MTNVLEAKERNESTQLHDSAYGMNIIHESIPVPMTLVFHWIASELCSLPWMPADSQPPPRRPVAAAGRWPAHAPPSPDRRRHALLLPPRLTTASARPVHAHTIPRLLPPRQVRVAAEGPGASIDAGRWVDTGDDEVARLSEPTAAGSAGDGGDSNFTKRTLNRVATDNRDPNICT